MSSQRYPRTVDIYKGEGRILLIPLIVHIGGYRVRASKFYVCECKSLSEIGKKVFEALNFIDKSPKCVLTRKELGEMKPNHFSSRYKTWKTFYKNHYAADARLFENGELHIYGGYSGEILPIKLSKNSSTEDIGRAIIEMFERVEESYGEISESKNSDSSLTDKNKPSSVQQKTSTTEKITLSNTSHLAEDEFYGSGDSKYKISFRIDDSFCEFKSHSAEVSMLHIYAPGYDPEWDDDIVEGTVPCFLLLVDDEIFKAVESYKNKRTFKGAKELVPLSGMFYFKAKKIYHGHLMYFYAIDMCDGYLNNLGLCMVYPKSYEGTDDEKNLMIVLDKIAESYTEKRIV